MCRWVAAFGDSLFEKQIVQVLRVSAIPRLELSSSSRSTRQFPAFAKDSIWCSSANAFFMILQHSAHWKMSDWTWFPMSRSSGLSSRGVLLTAAYDPKIGHELQALVFPFMWAEGLFYRSPLLTGTSIGGAILSSRGSHQTRPTGFSNSQLWSPMF